MATVSEDLRTFTMADSTVASLVGNMHELHVPQVESKPYIYFARISTEDERAMDSATGDDPFRHMFVVECWGETPEDADGIAVAVRNRLNNYRGTMGSQTVQGVFVNSQSDDYESRSDGSDRGFYLNALTVEVCL